METWLLLPNDRVIPVTIMNISEDGFMARAETSLEPGLMVGVVIPGYGIVPATLRWGEAGEIGGRFRTPLNFEKLKRLPVGKSSLHTFLESEVRQPPM